jgi:uncharacterized surface protein with fasciclin (FAS1) repeats
MTTKHLFARAALALALTPLALSAAHAQAPAAAAPAVVPASPTAPTAPAAPARPVVANGDIIATAQASGQFSTFLKALDAANLTSVVKTTNGLTVFAPTDAAFAALPAGELQRLMDPANAAQLQKILTYHLINAKVDSTKIKGAKGDVKPGEGASVTLDGSGPSLMVDNADIVQADVMATNGVVHVIDKVLTPKDMPGAQAAAATDSAASQPASASAAAPAAR